MRQDYLKGLLVLAGMYWLVVIATLVSSIF